MSKTFFVAFVLALSSSAMALSNSFSYQGNLSDGGTPANGSYDLQFQLQTSAGANVGAPILRDDVSVASGVFSVELDFGTAITSADFRLQIGVRPGASVGAFTTLAPTTSIRPTPQAQVAGIASEAVTVSPNAITSAMIADGGVGNADLANSSVASLNVVDGSLAGFDLADNSIASSKLLDGTVSLSDVDVAQIQARVSQTCAAGSSIREISAGGTVTCETDDGGSGGGGTVTSVATGTGLTGGPITTSGTIAIANFGVTNGMIATGAVNSSSIADGSITNTDINSNSVQRRVSSTCAAGSSISAVNQDGTVTCETDDLGAGWNLTGNASTNPATNFIGTTDDQPLVFKTDGVRSLTITPTGVGANIVAGTAGNIVENASVGATIAGGGNTGTINRVTDNYGAIGGGAGNRAGDANGLSSNAEYATVGGGSSNQAIRLYATVGGGEDNSAAGQASAVVGGQLNAAQGAWSSVIGGSVNCAGGDSSVAGGSHAKVRPGTGAAEVPCHVVATSGDANGDEGTFMWADESSNTDYVSSGPNQFLVRADGGVMFNTTSLPFTGDDLVVAARALSGDADSDLTLATRSARRVQIFASDTSGTLFITPNNLANAATSRLVVGGGSGGNATLSNGGTWTNASSRTFKTDFAAVDTRDVLARVVSLPISTWNYIDSAEGAHMGPVAEDFKAAFGLAGDGKSIATVDADGVALAAIQGLNQKLETENAALRREIDALRALVLERIANDKPGQ